MTEEQYNKAKDIERIRCAVELLSNLHQFGADEKQVLSALSSMSRDRVDNLFKETKGEA